MINELDMAGIQVHQEILEDLDHDFPMDFEARLSRALKDLKTASEERECGHAS